MRPQFLALVTILAFFACHSHTHETEPHEDHSLAYTLYTSSAELFVEFAPLVVGDSISFGAHLTRLGGYQPFRDGELTVSLVSDEKIVSATAGVSEVPGIFRPVLVPTSGGTQRLVFEWKNARSTERFVFDSADVFESEEEAISCILGEVEDPLAIRFTKEQAWKTEFEVMAVRAAPFSEVIYTSGQILPANGDETLVVAPYAGIVSMTGNMLVAGKEVQKGEKLLSLSGKGLLDGNISVRYANLRAEYERAKANFERLEPLVAEKIATQREFLDAKAAYEQATADFENLRANYDGEHKPINAPQSGFVKNVLVSEGAFVDAGDPLVSIAKNRRLMIRADVSQTHWHCLPDIREANFMTPYNGEFYNTRDLGGRLVSYSRTASNSSWSTPVFFEVNNTRNLIPGSFIEVYLLAAPRPGVIAIPVSALTEEQGNFFVFVQLAGESFEKREVKTGVSNGTEIEITYGLKPGERIVSKGAYQVKLASLSSALPAHSHDH